MENHNQSQLEQFARIKVVGVGGGGCNAVERMIKRGRVVAREERRFP